MGAHPPSRHSLAPHQHYRQARRATFPRPRPSNPGRHRCMAPLSSGEQACMEPRHQGRLRRRVPCRCLRCPVIPPLPPRVAEPTSATHTQSSAEAPTGPRLTLTPTKNQPSLNPPQHRTSNPTSFPLHLPVMFILNHDHQRGRIRCIGLLLAERPGMVLHLPDTLRVLSLHKHHNRLRLVRTSRGTTALA